MKPLGFSKDYKDDEMVPEREKSIGDFAYEEDNGEIK